MDSYREVPFPKWKNVVESVHSKVPFTHIELEDENSAVAIQPNKPYLSFLKEKGITSHLHLRSDQLLDKERVRWLAEMGVIRIHIGVESGSSRILNLVMHKHATVENHYIAARNLSQAGIEEVATAIVANPTETWPEMRDTLRMLQQLHGIFPPRRFRATVYVLASLPGTSVYADIRKMHLFCKVIDEIEAAGGPGAAMLSPGIRSRLESWFKVPHSASGTSSPKAVDSIQSLIAAYLDGKTDFEVLAKEARKWLWPMPNDLRGWTKTSAAFNPGLPAHINAIYLVAGIHFNKEHKGKQNFPGWKQILIKPFDLLSDLRFWLAAECGLEWALKGTALESWLVAKLLNWASQRSVGVKTERIPSENPGEDAAIP